ncbi:hypothetical protein EBZ80_23670 [bacterium]|nr:hypothetical protein [bacterium]
MRRHVETVQVLHVKDRADMDMSCIGKMPKVRDFSIHVRKDTDVYLDDPITGTCRLLFAFRKAAIGQTAEWSSVLSACFDTPMLVSDRRFRAAGVSGERVPVRSGVIGFYDRLTPQQKSALRNHLQRKVHVGGRATAFTRHYPDRWNRSLPFLQMLSSLYRETCPHYYRKQRAFLQDVEEAMRIPHSVFTTVTVNEDWATCTHTDTGDFPHGMSCLAVLGKNFRGGHLGFPLRGVLVHMEPGDVLFMDSHEPHGNTPLTVQKDGKRLSLVCYARTDLAKFHQPVTLPDGTTYFV